jgi:hypothetical protein
MGFFRRGGKKEEKVHTTTVVAISELEKICADDKDTYEALRHTMFLDPRKIGTSADEAAENARRLENEKNPERARIWYDIAGGLAIYGGDAKKVMEFFGQSERLLGMKYPILKRADKAVAKAREYYEKNLKA